MTTSTEAPCLCPYCQSPVSEEERRPCPACGTPHHAECWEENGGCTVYGCSQVPATQMLQEVEIPLSYWGQETKECPICAARIQAMAIRCRHCGTVFRSARPAGAEASDGPRAYWLIALAVLCLIPLTAPLALVASLLLRRRANRLFPDLSPHIRVLYWLGIVVAAFETAIMTATLVLSSVLDTGT